MVDAVHTRDFEILGKVAAGRTLFIDGFALGELKQRGLVTSQNKGTHTAWVLTDKGRERLETETKRRDDDARRTSDASAGSGSGGDAAGKSKRGRRLKAGRREEEKAAGR
ncbi:hypothetical protein [Paraburkholderia fungorum]|jgi:hypothetical protein|uniref:hypothetical protein n=1 Tax=Paraburkholderia fungorum TaxID=134537 RepID=UPI000D06371C|nr:hypothetical protein [Paraburkholderia fungorum]